MNSLFPSSSSTLLPLLNSPSPTDMLPHGNTPSSISSLPFLSSFYPFISSDSTLTSAQYPSSHDNISIRPYEANIAKQLNTHKKNADRDIYLEPSNPTCIKLYMSPGIFQSLILTALVDLPINEPIIYDDLFCTLVSLKKSYAKCGIIFQEINTCFCLKGPSSNSTIRVHAYNTQSMLMIQGKEAKNFP